MPRLRVLSNSLSLRRSSKPLHQHHGSRPKQDHQLHHFSQITMGNVTTCLKKALGRSKPSAPPPRAGPDTPYRHALAQSRIPDRCCECSWVITSSRGIKADGTCGGYYGCSHDVRKCPTCGVNFKKIYFMLFGDQALAAMAKWREEDAQSGR